MNNIINLSENQISHLVIGKALKVHRTLGPGLLESAYSKCLTIELNRENLLIEREKYISLEYEGIPVEKAYKVDLMINNKVVIEIKAVSSLTDVHLSQILTYLKLTNCRLGLIINFNVNLLKDGIRRVVNNL